MSALAAFVALKGGQATGSDRAFDLGGNGELRRTLEALDIALFPQDGSAVRGDCAAVISSTAVEAQVPDLAEAARLGVPVLHRSDLLAHLVVAHRTLAVTGTSGKSTTAALLFELLRGVGLDSSLITGAELVSLQGCPHPGNCFAGGSDLLVIEADESDGSLVRYSPAVGVVMNLQKDHKPQDEVLDLFRTFSARVRDRLVVGEGSNLAELREGALVYGFGPEAEVRAEQVETGSEGSSFTVLGTRFRMPLPGAHNVENAVAALAACKALGVPMERLVEPMAAFQGVARRFQKVGQARGVEVVDDFAHNPAKVEAALRTAQARAARVLAVFQPHGFGPLRFLRAEFVDLFSGLQRPQDRLWFLDVYFAGGTVVRDISSEAVVAEIAARGSSADHAPSRESLIATLAATAREGDLVLVMGARDPSLTDLAKSILAAL
jgi:UDP-N-acetylmuramate--alanine ligase